MRSEGGLRAIVVGLLMGVAASIAGAVIYALFIARRIDDLRERLRRGRSSRLRRRYLRALVDAVRGKAAIDNTLLLAASVCGAIAFGAGWLSVLPSRVEAPVAETAQQVAAIRARFDSTMPFTPQVPVTAESVDSSIAALEQEAQSLVAEARDIAITAYALLGAIVLGLIWFVTLWVPFALLRALFAHEIGRFAIRIQGLASKDELVALTRAELGVTDEHSLRAYVTTMREIAARHGVPELTNTFELWSASEAGRDAQ